MRLHTTPALRSFDPAERFGLKGGLASTKLSAADLKGVIYQNPGAKARSSPELAPRTGIAAIDADMAAVDADPVNRHARLEAYAKQLVNQTFFGTMLKQMRDSTFKSDLFEGGRGGQAFNSLLDQRMVEQMSRGAGKQLVNAIVRKLEAHEAYRKQNPTERDDRTGKRQPVRTGVGANTPAELPDRHSSQPSSNLNGGSHGAGAHRA